MPILLISTVKRTIGLTRFKCLSCDWKRPTIGGVRGICMKTFHELFLERVKPGSTDSTSEQFFRRAILDDCKVFVSTPAIELESGQLI